MASITIKGAEYPLLFDMNLQEKIQERYGDVREITKQVFRYSEAKWLLAEAINEGYKYQEYFNGCPHKEITAEQLGMILNINDFANGSIAKALLDALNESLSGDKKKLTMEDLAEQALKIMEQQEKS